jgi:hypothetical protein
MNTSYDITESSILIAKLIRLTRDAKIEWEQRKSAAFPGMIRYQTPIDEDSEALVWSTSKEAGFRIFEKVPPSPLARSSWNAPFGLNPPMNVPADSAPLLHIAERDLVAITFDHINGPSQGESYVNLMILLELARRSSDKIEPKIDRVKQFLDKLAV